MSMNLYLQKEAPDGAFTQQAHILVTKVETKREIRERVKVFENAVSHTLRPSLQYMRENVRCSNDRGYSMKRENGTQCRKAKIVNIGSGRKNIQETENIQTT